VRAEQRFQADRGEPLGLWRRPEPAPETHSDLRVEAFEYTSRGDRVPGRLLLPPAGHGPFPLVLLQHGNEGSKDAPYMLPVAAPWVRAGAAVASIDFPLHGERANMKLTELLRGALGVEAEPTPAGEAVLREFVRQAVIDLQRALDAAQELPGVDARRIAYAGLSLGSMVGAIFCARDPRPCAAALALGGGGFGPPGVDPTHHVGRFAPRPILFVNASRDERVPRAAAEALHAAAGEPKEILWFDAAHDDLPGRALKAMWLFLQRHLSQIEVPA
jgi:fermentation-respiration switch protein FrsA (DUF1100 family)